MLRITFASVDTIPEIVGNGDEPLVVMPFTNAVLAKRSAAQLARRADVSGTILCVHDPDQKGFIAVTNAVFRRSAAPYFAYVAQDAFAGRGWLSHGLAGLLRKNGTLLAFNDGKWHGALAAFGIVQAAWAKSNYEGNLFHPGYKRHYADVELTLIAMQQQKFRYAPEAVLIEVDWKKEQSAVDLSDRQLYYKRGQTGYDRKVTNPGLRRLFK